MVDRTFRCNLCRVRKESAYLVGLYWEWEPAVQRDAIHPRNPTEVEHHLCAKCCRDIAAIWEDKKFNFKILEEDE